MNLLTVLLALFVLCYGALALIIWRRPLVGKIALREAVRRPGQTAVVVAGLMIAGASIFLIQVISDSMYEYNRTSALRSWGRDDIELTAGGTYFDPALTQRLAADPSLGKTAAFQGAVIVTGSVVDVDRNFGKPGVQLTGLDLGVQHRFDPFLLADGRSTYGDELGIGGVFLTQALADDLDARVGDRLSVQAGGPSPQLATVVGIVQRRGAGAYGNPRSVFGSLPTIQRLLGSDRINLVRVSAPGDGDREVAAGRQLAPFFRAAVARDGLQVFEPKRGVLELATRQREVSRGFLTSFGVIVALAATAMVANLAVLLAEERRPRLAVLRALGLTRGGLIQVSVTEGALYSLAGALFGLPAGLALAWLATLQSPPAPDPGPGGTGFILSVAPGSLLGSVAAASLINLVTVLIVSIGTSSMAISAAIRDLPEPQHGTRWSRRRLAYLALLGIGGLAAVAFGNPFLRASGGALMIAAASGLLRGRVSDRIRFSGAGLAAAAWAIAYWWYVSRTISAASSTGPFAAALVISVVGLSVLVTSNLGVLEHVGGLVGRPSGWLRATLRPALAYSSRRPLRTGLVIAAFSIVTAVLIIVQTGVSAARHDVTAATGGWDVRATVVGTDQLALPASLAPQVARQESLPSRTFLGPVKWLYPDFRGTLDWHQESVTVYGLSAQQLTSGMMPLTSRDPTFPSDEAAWAAISRDPGLVASSLGIGSVAYLATGQSTVRFKVVAQLPSPGGSPGLLPGLVGSQPALAPLVGSPPGATLLLKAANGTAPQALTRNLQRALLAQGADASTTLQLMQAQYDANHGADDFFVAMMRVGLLVGILGLGAVALRAVIERRRAIGVLRAVGFLRLQVLAGMLIETALIATVGLVVGLAVALGLGGPLLTSLSPKSQFSLDYGDILLTVGLVYAAVLLVTFLPALRAARLPPAEALRAVG
jgi:putative ABC transport system permease protein